MWFRLLLLLLFYFMCHCYIRVFPLCSDENPEHREGVQQLRANVEFGAHVVAVALQKLQQMVDKGTCDGAGCGQDKLFTHCCTLGR